MVHLMFPVDPDLGPSGKVSIFGQPRCNADSLRAYAARRNPQAPDVAEIYLEKAESYGIRGDVAFCQAMLDTQVWTAEPQGPPYKPFAYLIWGGLSYFEQSVAELERRTERHLQRLSAVVDSHKTDEPCWEDLGGSWAVSDMRYGHDVVAIWRNMMIWRGVGAMRAKDQHKETGDEEAEAALAAAASLSQEDQSGEDTNRNRHDNRTVQAFDQMAESAIRTDRTAEDHMAWLSAHAWVPTPPPHPGRKVSWGELARVIGSLEKQRK